MSRFDFFASAVALVVGLALAAPSFARSHHGRHHKDRGPGHLLEIAEKLDLDEETREEIRGIVEGSRPTGEKLRGEVRELRGELRDLLESDSPDESAVMAKAEAIGDAETEMHKHRLSTLLKIRALLTPEQRAELRRIREEARREKVQPLIDACEADMEALCPDLGDRHDRMRCMREHRDELSDECREAIRSHRRERRGPRGDRAPNGCGDL